MRGRKSTHMECFFLLETVNDLLIKQLGDHFFGANVASKDIPWRRLGSTPSVRIWTV
jgi:hypothetical protein